MNYQYFSENEFRRAVPACSLSDMDARFMRHLEVARYLAGVPFIINSAYRASDYEKSQGRPGTSSHCKGLAVDIRCLDVSSRLKIVKALLQVGIYRIGIAPTYIHCDLDNEKPACIWLYG